jgi:hypothetical protein
MSTAENVSHSTNIKHWFDFLIVCVAGRYGSHRYDTWGLRAVTSLSGAVATGAFAAVTFSPGGWAVVQRRDKQRTHH